MHSRRFAVALVWTMAVSTFLVVGPAGPAAAGPPEWVAALDAPAPTPSSPAWREPPSAPLSRSVGVAPPKVEFPAPATWETRVGARAAAPDDRRPVAVRAKGPAAGTATVRVLDRAAARRAGASGFVFTVAGPRNPVEVTVDYSGFAEAHGAGYADRLRLVALPACALADRPATGCATAGRPVPARNDVPAGTLTADVADPSAVGAFAVVSSISGEEGTFAATPTSMASGWQTAPGAGAFTYSYPVDVPAPAGGSAPTVALNYSSAAIDGMTLARNTQASPSGTGWSDFANSFIERQYQPCYEPPIVTADLCWGVDNAAISLAGVSGPLLPVGANRWRAQSDPGWVIERLTGAPYTTIHQGQYWKAVGPDGTQYFFGSNHMPGKQTNSILAVPVVADTTGDPCRARNDAVGSCDQGWRWYLDRVVDPDGNTQHMVYAREDNWYHSALGALGGQPMTKYHRGAVLSEIYYGGRGWDPDSFAARVTFGVQWRCGYLHENCPPATAEHDQASFPDTPTDLICDADGPCAVNAPSFFTARRYGWVRTEVKVGPAWRPVAQHNIVHEFGDGANDVRTKLRVKEIQHVALAFGKLSTHPTEPSAYPSTKFAYTFFDNRVDHGAHPARAMRHERLTRITNPFGGTVTVTYFRNRACAGTYRPRWDVNLRDCFPQQIKEGARRLTGVFNKYLVQRVTESAGLRSPDVVTSYAYEGDPAWGYDVGAFSRDEALSGWSLWRGYGSQVVTKGSARTRVVVFRGWDEDQTLQQVGAILVPTGHRDVWVTASTGQRFEDHSGLAGRVLEEQHLGTLGGVADSVLQSRVHEYDRFTTHNMPDTYRFDAEWFGVRTTTERVFSAPGVSRARRSQTTNDPVHLQPVRTLEEGWLDVTGDERCTITAYAVNTTAGMTAYPSSNKRVAGGCDSTQVLSETQTYYDGATTLGAPPTRGNPTRHRTRIDASRWAETTTAYDDLGRPTRATDANGGHTTTTYEVTAGAPVSQIPIRTTVTNVLGHRVITDFHPEFGVPFKQRDANDNLTEQHYDEFGRLKAVWLPTEPVAFAEPSYKFSYDPANRVVRSQRLTSDARTGATTFDDGWVVYDGFWRERQNQGLSTVAGRTVVAETTYDERGLVRDQTVEQDLPGAPGAYIVGDGTWLNRTRLTHDELGRTTRSEWLRGTSVIHDTETAYGVDSVTVTGPDGRRVRERVDGHGRTTAVEEYDGTAWVAATYGYDLADRLTSATDPAGNRIGYSYNQAGWRTAQQDPNRGSATFAYDLAGNRTSTVDALGNQIHTRYDALGRPTERRSGSATGPLLAGWAYDDAPGGKGKAYRETSYAASGAWVTETTGYDSKGRPTGSAVTVPAGVPGLAGVYRGTLSYDRADRVRTIGLPGIGGLPAESVTTEYNALGLPTRMVGLAEYVWNVTYDARGRKTSAGVGPRPGGTPWMARRWTYDVDQRGNGGQTLVGATVISDHQLVFDLSGVLAEKVTRQSGTAWRECFDYDGRNRLTAAHTVAVGAACGAGTPGTGDRPYVHSYAYSADGRLTQRTENGTTTGYTYPAAGGTRPHAPTRVGSAAYTWDGRGNLLTRGGETFSWDVQGLLRSVTGTGGTTSFEYDAAGQRLLRRTPDGLVTVYVGGHEVTVTATGAVVTAVRPYTFDGELIATRTGAGVEYVVTDPTGSVEMAVGSGSSTPTATRAYEPFGQVRAAAGEPATDRGFLGQVEDASTKLSYLNARYYDASTGLFVSTDPLIDTNRPHTLNPYAYAGNNPVTYADPGGMKSDYAWGVESENAQLRQHNKELIAHIGRLTSHIEHLQDVIRKQQKAINKLVDYAHALEAEIQRQASIIQQLQDRVRYLEGVVVAQQREIGRLRAVVARQQQIIRYQAGVIRYQAGVIAYYKGVVNVLGFRLWGGTPQYAWVMNSIHSFRGIPAGAFAYDRISILQAAVASRDAVISRLMAGGGGGGGGGTAAGAAVDAVSRVVRPTIGPDRDYSGWRPRLNGGSPEVDYGSSEVVVTPNGQAYMRGPHTGNSEGGCMSWDNPNGGCAGGAFVEENWLGWGVACIFGLVSGGCLASAGQSVVEDGVTYNIRQRVLD